MSSLFRSAQILYPENYISNTRIIRCDCPGLCIERDEEVYDPEDQHIIDAISFNVEEVLSLFPELEDEEIDFFASIKRSREKNFEGCFFVNFRSEKIANVFCGLTPEGKIKRETRKIQKGEQPNFKSGKKCWADEVEEDRVVEVTVKTFVPRFSVSEEKERNLSFIRAEVDTNRLVESKRGDKVFLEDPDVVVSSALPAKFSERVLKECIEELLAEALLDEKVDIQIVPLEQHDPKMQGDEISKALLSFEKGKNFGCFAVLFLRKSFLEIRGEKYNIFFSRKGTELHLRDSPKKTSQKKNVSSGEKSRSRGDVSDWEVVRKKK